MPPKRGSNALTVGGLVLFIAAMSAYPLWYVSRGTQISTSAQPINPDAAIRGAYVNSGSKDMGLDPKAGKYGQRAL